MPSEIKTENVMLTGKTAYFKKTGSMVNHGVVISDDQTKRDIYTDGFIDEGSKIGAAELESSTDYINTLNSMRDFLRDDFISEDDDYLVKVNAENIVSQLQPKATAISQLVHHIGSNYKNLPYLRVKNTGDVLDFSLSLHLENNFILEIKSNFLIKSEAFTLIDGGEKLTLRQNADGDFFLNDTQIEAPTHNVENELVISQENGILYVDINNQRVSTEIEGFEGEVDITLNFGFTSQLNEIKVYGDTGATHHIVAKLKKDTNTPGLYDYQTMRFYPVTTVDILLQTIYNRANIWNGALDLGYHPSPNTGLEIKYSQYGSQSTSTNTYRGIIGCLSSMSVANVLNFGIILGSGSKFYAARSNNIASWVDSGVATTTTTENIITLNKNNDGMFTCSGGYTFSKTLSSSATITNTNNATLYLNGVNDLAYYTPLKYVKSSWQIPTGQNDIYIYYVKIYEGTELVREFRPGYSFSDSGVWTTGMIDVLTGEFRSKDDYGKCSFSPSGGVLSEY